MSSLTYSGKTSIIAETPQQSFNQCMSQHVAVDPWETCFIDGQCCQAKRCYRKDLCQNVDIYFLKFPCYDSALDIARPDLS